MTDGYRFEPKPTEPATFDGSLFNRMMEAHRRLDALYGPRLQRISACAPLAHWLVRQVPLADAPLTAAAVFGVAVVVDDEVPLDSLRFTYADGTHKDTPVMTGPDHPTGAPPWR